MNLIDITESNFEQEVMQSAIPVIVDYWAPWCGPCKAIAPIFEGLANSYQGKLKFAKVNVDNNQDIAKQYDVRGIPTLMIFKDGQVVARETRFMSKADIEALIQTNLPDSEEDDSQAAGA